MESKLKKSKTVSKSPEKVKGDDHQEAIHIDSDADSDDYEMEVDYSEEESGSQYETETEIETTETEDSVDLGLVVNTLCVRYFSFIIHVILYLTTKFNHQNILLFIAYLWLAQIFEQSQSMLCTFHIYCYYSNFAMYAKITTQKLK